jgi:hypothetical protein
MEWIRIDFTDDSTQPPIGKKVLIVSEEGDYEVGCRLSYETRIYCEQTDSGAAIGWAEIPYLDDKTFYKWIKLNEDS